MEALGQDYEDIMSMPSGRRRRLCDEKAHQDHMRHIRAKNRK